MSAVSRIDFVIKNNPLENNRVPATPPYSIVCSLFSKNGRGGGFLVTAAHSLVYPACLTDGSPVPDRLVRAIFPKTERFPAFERLLYLDGQYGKLPGDQIRQAQYRQLSVLPPFNDQRDDLMLRYQTIWYMLAELMRSATLPPESNQWPQFLSFILTLMKEELAYVQTSPNVRFSVPRDFLVAEVLDPIAAELRERCTGVERANMPSMEQLRGFADKYPLQGGNFIPLIPHNPCVSIQAAAEVRQPSRQSLAELGIYGVKPSNTLTAHQAPRFLI